MIQFSLLPESNKSRIFWVVSVPLAITAWIFFMSPLRDWIKKTREDLGYLKLNYPNDRHLRRAYLRLLIKCTFKKPKHKEAETTDDSPFTVLELVDRRMKKVYFNSGSSV
jgi:hypothetical protein